MSSFRPIVRPPARAHATPHTPPAGIGGSRTKHGGVGAGRRSNRFRGRRERPGPGYRDVVVPGPATARSPTAVDAGQQLSPAVTLPPTKLTSWEAGGVQPASGTSTRATRQTRVSVTRVDMKFTSGWGQASVPHLPFVSRPVSPLLGRLWRESLPKSRTRLQREFRSIYDKRTPSQSQGCPEISDSAPRRVAVHGSQLAQPNPPTCSE